MTKKRARESAEITTEPFGLPGMAEVRMTARWPGPGHEEQVARMIADAAQRLLDQVLGEKTDHDQQQEQGWSEAS
jgi:hypothetical protein